MAYVETEDIRALDGMDDEETFPDTMIEAAIEWATELIDDYCGTSFEHKDFTITLDGSNDRYLRLPILYPQSITACTIDGEPKSTTGWVLQPEGLVAMASGSFTYTAPGRNVVISGTAGKTAEAPAQIKWACQTLARYFCAELVTRIPERAISLQNDFGQMNLAIAGGPGRPTAIPDVNAVLNRFKESAPLCF